MRRRSLFLLGVLLWLGAAEPTAAQDGRRGFWWGLGFSYGAAWVRCDICEGSRGGGFSASGAVGATLTPSFRVGAELDGWLRSEEAVDEYLGSAGLVLHWYPKPTGGLYLKAGVAYVAFRIADQEDALTSSGIGPQFGAGYEAWLGSRVSVQPYLNAIVTTPTGHLQFNGDRQADGVSLALLQLGIGVTWH